MTRGNLIQLALGEEEARKVDTAIPQGVFDQMTEAARNNVAGWYYAPEVKLFGRLLTQSECWQEIVKKLKQGKIRAYLAGFGGTEDIAYVVSDWPCLRYHVEHGEIYLEEA